MSTSTGRRDGDSVRDLVGIDAGVLRRLSPERRADAVADLVSSFEIGVAETGQLQARPLGARRRGAGEKLPLPPSLVSLTQLLSVLAPECRNRTASALNAVGHADRQTSAEAAPLLRQVERTVDRLVSEFEGEINPTLVQTQFETLFEYPGDESLATIPRLESLTKAWHATREQYSDAALIDVLFLRFSLSSLKDVFAECMSDLDEQHRLYRFIELTQRTQNVSVALLDALPPEASFLQVEMEEDVPPVEVGDVTHDLTTYCSGWEAAATEGAGMLVRYEGEVNWFKLFFTTISATNKEPGKRLRLLLDDRLEQLLASIDSNLDEMSALLATLVANGMRQESAGESYEGTES